MMAALLLWACSCGSRATSETDRGLLAAGDVVGEQVEGPNGGASDQSGDERGLEVEEGATGGRLEKVARARRAAVAGVSDEGRGGAETRGVDAAAFGVGGESDGGLRGQGLLLAVTAKFEVALPDVTKKEEEKSTQIELCGHFGRTEGDRLFIQMMFMVKD